MVVGGSRTEKPLGILVSLEDSSLLMGSGAEANDNGANNRNTGIRTNALLNNSTSYSNIAVSHQALPENTIGLGNVALDYRAIAGKLNKQHTGSYN